MKGLPTSMNGETPNSRRKYLNDLNKSLVKRGIKSYAFLAAGCFALLVAGMFSVSMILGDGNEGLSAKSNSIVKFEKVNESIEHSQGEVGMLANNIDTETNSNAQSLGDYMNEESRYVEIDLSTARVSDEEAIQAAEDTVHSDIPEGGYTAYVDYQSNIRSEPAKDGAVLADKQRGDEVVIVGAEGDWYKIMWGDDGYAYLSKSCVVESKPE